MSTFTRSVSLNVTSLNNKGKIFKLVTEMVRAAVKNIHGYAAQKGLRDETFRTCDVIIRFANGKKRDEFASLLEQVLKPALYQKIQIRFKRPITAKQKMRPVSFLKVA